MSYGFLYLCGEEIIYYLDPVINGLIDQGYISQETVSHYATMTDLFKFSPFAFLVGLIVYVFERSKGTQIPANTFFEYSGMLFAGIIGSMIIVFMYGTLIDIVQVTMDRLQFAGTNLASFAPVYNAIYFIIQCGYMGTMLPGFAATVVFMVHPFILQTDNFYSSYDEDTEYSMQQM